MKKVMKIVALLAVAGMFIGTFVFLYGKSRVQPEPFGTVSPVYGDISKKILLTGHIEPRKEINIKSRIAGIVQSIEKEAGAPVKKGEIIATVRIIPEMLTLSSARSRVNVARINYKNNLETLGRNQKLYKAASISVSKMDEVSLAVDLAREEVKAAEENLQLILEGRVGDSDTRSNTLIRATIDGMVLNVPVKQGDSVIESNTMNEGTTIAVIADMKEMIFKGAVDEIDIEKIATGMPMTMTLSADPKVTLKGRTEFISPKGKSTNGAVKFDLRATLEMPEGRLLRSGYSAAGEIVLAERKHVLTLDEGVVKFTDGGTFVDVVTREEPLAIESRAIETGLSDGIRIEVISGVGIEEKIRVDASLLKRMVNLQQNDGGDGV